MASGALLISGGSVIPPKNAARAATIDAKEEIAAPARKPRNLQLEVFIDGSSTGLIAAVSQYADGSLAISPEQLCNVGIAPAREAIDAGGMVRIARLPGVSFRYDEARQSVNFTVAFGARSTRIIDASKATRRRPAPEARSGTGALLNYTLYGSAGRNGSRSAWDFQGLSGWVEARAFSRLGVFASSFVATTSRSMLYDSMRLDTTWSYSDQARMTTYRIGDVTTGGLSWTRPVRLGGVRVERNFALRPDLVTMPLPQLSGSAAVPSTVDVYVDNTRRLTQTVPAGPFEVTNLPVVTGSGTARLVVRDALGRQTTTESAFFASSRLLAPGLLDYSAEAGFARRFYGVESNGYDRRFMASGTFRYGLTGALTLEAHGEGGGGLANGGGGAVFGLGPSGVGSVAVSASSFQGRSGLQVAGSLELQLWRLRLQARTQRTFGGYADIASVTAPSEFPWYDAGYLSSTPPRALDQVSISVPLGFDPATINFSYTQIERSLDSRSRILGFSASRTFGHGASAFATAFADIENRHAYGFFVGLSIPFGSDITTSTGLTSGPDGVAVTTQVMKSGGTEIGTGGWRLRDTEGAYTDRAATANYRSSIGRVEGGVEQYDGSFHATAQADGAIVLSDGNVFATNRVDDAFAVVDTGAPGVDVLYENRPVGRTDASGKLLVSGLRSYERNQIAIDPSNLPIDTSVEGTRQVAVPADRSGTVVKFEVKRNADAALVTLRGEDGRFLEPGAVGHLGDGTGTFVVGYDGQAYITGLKAQNTVVVEQPGRGNCKAEFAFKARRGTQVTIPDVSCRRMP